MLGPLFPVSWTLLAHPAWAGLAPEGEVVFLALPPPQGDEVAAEPTSLPEGVSGVLALREGEIFLLQLDTDEWQGHDVDQVTAALADLLPLAGFGEAVWSLAVTEEGVEEPPIDPGVLEEERDARAEAMAEQVATEVGPLASDTIEELTVLGYEQAERLLPPRRTWRFDQLVDGAPIRGGGLVATTVDGVLRTVEGALHVDLSAANGPSLSSEDAESEAIRWFGDQGEVLASTPEVLAVGAELRHAWRVELQVDTGPYDVWVDADTGEVLQVLPQFSFVSAQGVVFDSSGATGGSLRMLAFDVDPPVNREYRTFSFLPDQVWSDLNADGTRGLPLSLPDDGTRFANYAVMPFTNTFNLFDATAPGYNWRFQHVSAKAWVAESHRQFATRGARPFPLPNLWVNMGPAVCGLPSQDNACFWPPNTLQFGIGSRTLGLGTGVRNTALDGTMVAHESAHLLHRVQMAGQGVLHPSLSEGLADFWSLVVVSDAVSVGDTAAGNSADVETGFVPRLPDAIDTFPEHLALFGGNNSPHANGQIVAFALTSARAELARRTVLGPLLLDAHLMGALPAVGLGQTAGPTEVEIHRAFRRLLIGLLGRAGATLDAQDILVGFARAGILVSPHEAVISIDRDVIAQTQPTPPTFTVWTGEDWWFHPDGRTMPLAGNPNPVFEIELANDAAFSFKPVSSGSLSMPPFSSTGLPTATWSPSVGEWDALRTGGTRLYYRVTAHDGSGGRLRTSTAYNAQAVALPVTYALLNPSASPSCSTTPAGASLGLLAVALLVRRRRDAEVSRAGG